MSELELSIIIPSVGRPTLERTIRSLIRQPGDLRWEAIVVGDSHADTWRRQLEKIQPLLWRLDCEYLGVRPAEYGERTYVPSNRLLYFEYDGGVHCYGQPQRNAGIAEARGQYLSWLGDDDVYLPGAFPSIAARIRGAPLAPHLFRWVSPWKQMMWGKPGVIGEAPGEIDAECIVTPNVQDRLGVWANLYQGDWYFIKETVEKWAAVGVEAVWCPEVIAQAQPSEVEDWTRLAGLTREHAYAGQ